MRDLICTAVDLEPINKAHVMSYIFAENPIEKNNTKSIDPSANRTSFYYSSDRIT